MKGPEEAASKRGSGWPTVASIRALKFFSACGKLKKQTWFQKRISSEWPTTTGIRTSNFFSACGGLKKITCFQKRISPALGPQNILSPAAGWKKNHDFKREYHRSGLRRWTLGSQNFFRLRQAEKNNILSKKNIIGMATASGIRTSICFYACGRLRIKTYFQKRLSSGWPTAAGKIFMHLNAENLLRLRRHEEKLVGRGCPDF